MFFESFFVPASRDSGCIICKSKESRLRRGLCQTHYQQFIHQMRSFDTDEQRDRFEEELIQLQMLLPKAKTGRKSTYDNPFISIANKIKPESTSELIAREEAEAEREAQEQLDRAAKKVGRLPDTKEKPKKKRNHG